MSADFERELRDARPPLDAPEGVQRRVRQRLIRDERGVAATRWGGRHLSRGGRIAAVAVALGVSGTALAAGVIGLRSSSARAAVSPQAPTAWAPYEVISESIPSGYPVPTVAVSDNGYIAAAWERSGRIELRTRPPGGPWRPVETLRRPGGFLTDPTLALGPDGRGVLMWRERRGGRDAILPLRDPSGRVFDEIRRRVGLSYIVAAQNLDARSGSLGQSVDVSPAANRRGDFKALTARADGKGRVVALWDRNGRVESASLGTDGRWAAVQTLGHVPGRPANLSLAVNRSGVAAAAWIAIGQYDPQAPPGSSLRIVAANRSTDGKWETPSVVADRATNMNIPAITVDDDGRSVAAWTSFTDDDFFRGGGGAITASAKPAGGAWSAPVSLSLPGEPGGGVNLAVTGRNEVVAVWTRVLKSLKGPRASPRRATVQRRLVADTWSPQQVISDSGGDSQSRTQVPMASDGSGRVVTVFPTSRGLTAETRGGATVPARSELASGAAWFTFGRSTISAGRSGTAAVVAAPYIGRGTRIITFIREPTGSRP